MLIYKKLSVTEDYSKQISLYNYLKKESYSNNIDFKKIDSILISTDFFTNIMINNYQFYINLYDIKEINNIKWIGVYMDIYLLITPELNFYDMYLSDKKTTLFNYQRILKMKELFNY